jgi:hypothetical protein
MFHNKQQIYVRQKLHTHTHTHTHIYGSYIALLILCKLIFMEIKVKCSCYRPSVAQRVGRGIALLFHDRGTRRR